MEAVKGTVSVDCCFCDCCVQASAVKVQKRLLNKPRSGVQLAADVIERVLATSGEKYLDTPEHELTWWQLSLLDVKLV